MLAHVDLCSGIGGFALGFQRAGLSKPVLFCDIEPWSRKILNKHWPDVPIAEDVKELANDPGQIINAINGRDSILSAGYPCQPFSAAGARRGFEDDRHIWPEILSIIQQVRPNWVVFENVSGHITLGLNEVLSDLADKANYSVQTFHIGAVSVDAPHRRMRLWIVGNRNDNGASSTTIKRGSQEASNNNTEGQKETIQSKGTSQPRNSASVERQPDLFQSEGSGDVANANDQGIRSRIRGASSQSLEEGSRGRDHNEGSRANGGAQDSEKSQDIQEALANAQSKRDHASEANAQTSSQSQGLRKSGGSSSNNNVANARRKHGSARNTAKLDKNTAKRSSRSIFVESGSSGQSEEDVANANSNGEKRNQPKDKKRRGSEQSRQDVAYPDGFRRFQADKEMERGKSELSDSMGVQPGEESTDVLNANSKGSQGTHNDSQSSRGLQQEPLQRCDDVANASNKQLKGRSEEQIHGERDLQRESGRGSENPPGGHAPLSKLGRMVNGLSTWVDEPPGIPRTGPSVKGRADRLKGLGNAIVPQIAERIGQTIKLIQLQGTKE